MTEERKPRGVNKRRPPGAVRQREAAEALVEVSSRATAYELANRSSGYGAAIRLGDGSVFWSKGWRMCSQGCRVPLDNWNHVLYFVEERRNGVITKRHTCKST